jgi:opacity protein-like surface antigen
MKKELTLLGLAALAAGGLHSTTASGREKEGTQDAEIYAGQIFGDRLTETNLSGHAPRLDDRVTYGARYTYECNDALGVELSAGHSPTFASHVAGGNVNLGLMTVDTDLAWSFMSRYAIKPYTVAGIGYAWADMDTMTGLVNGRQVSVQPSDSFTANIGLGAKYFVSQNLFLDLDSRYRYLNRIVSPYGQELNTVQTTLGVGWRF